jgi:hypothetical protein
MKPVAYAMFRDGEYYDAIHPDEQAKTVGEYDIPLYTHQYERPHNTVLVPCDKLAEMQNRIAELEKYLGFKNSGYDIISANVIPAKTLTDEEIQEIAHGFGAIGWMGDTTYEFARAILRKAEEK